MERKDAALQVEPDVGSRGLTASTLEGLPADLVQLAGRLIGLQSQIDRRRRRLDAPGSGVAGSSPGAGFDALQSVATALNAEIRDAIGRDAFYYEYQPIFSTDTGTVAAYEALLRWNRDGRAVLPGAFVVIAEETGIIVDMQQRLLPQIAASFTRIAPHVAIALNWSPAQLSQDGAVSSFIDRVRELRIAPPRIVIEITERTMMTDPELAHASIRRLKENGFMIALDDFGKGYCGLPYLRHLPIDRIKIDGSVLDELADSSRSRVILDSVIDLAHRLGTPVVAEGVETPQQLQLLQRSGCDYVQGFLLGRPSRDLIAGSAVRLFPTKGW